MRDEDRFKQFVDRNAVMGTYRIRMRRTAKLDWSRIHIDSSALNDQIVVTKSTLITNREFYEDGAMRSFDSRYPELPQYYDDTSSIYVETTAHPYECIYPRAVAEECDMIRESFDSVVQSVLKRQLRKEVIVWALVVSNGPIQPAVAVDFPGSFFSLRGVSKGKHEAIETCRHLRRTPGSGFWGCGSRSWRSKSCGHVTRMPCRIPCRF